MDSDGRSRTLPHQTPQLPRLVLADFFWPPAHVVSFVRCE